MKVKTIEVNSLLLAYLGDTVYEGYVRRYLIDQGITYWFEDWKNKCSDRETAYSFRKDDLVGDCELIITNSSRVGVRKLTFYNVIIQDATWSENGELEDATDRADLQAVLNFEHMSREWLNI